MDYTIKNLREVADSAAKFGYGELQEARFAGEDLNAADTGVSLQTVRPGKRQPFAHRHENAEEVYVVLAGTGRIKLDDEVRDVGPMDAIRIAPSVARAFEADAEADLELLVFGPRHEGDGEMLEDFWD